MSIILFNLLFLGYFDPPALLFVVARLISGLFLIEFLSPLISAGSGQWLIPLKSNNIKILWDVTVRCV